MTGVTQSVARGGSRVARRLLSPTIFFEAMPRISVASKGRCSVPMDTQNNVAYRWRGFDKDIHFPGTSPRFTLGFRVNSAGRTSLTSPRRNSAISDEARLYKMVTCLAKIPRKIYVFTMPSSLSDIYALPSDVRVINTPHRRSRNGMRTTHEYGGREREGGLDSRTKVLKAN
ncbi:hypothetical protein OF83DRAFT_1087253 [Amylostereum chailletii]|nr:hypothetical protein OF83DRAFT_1087253 [Amylostereum chailletii]